MSIELFEAHLRSWVGAWPPPASGIHVVSTIDRLQPGWDGAVRPLLGAIAPDGRAIVAVTAEIHREVAEILHGRPVELLDDRATCAQVGTATAGVGAMLGIGVLRWTDAVDESLEPLGIWMPTTDPRVPAWLRPFGGQVLVVLDDDGSYAAGVGIKRHDATGHELSVGTEPQHRGSGWARRLVATAARRHLQEVPIITYLHDPENTASARVADAVGIVDRGWRVLGVWGGAA